jgi:1,4-alpha-glucan branching enzyme
MKHATAQKPNPATHTIPVTLSCHVSDAKEVTVAGTFNDWQPNATPMQRDKNGNWTTTLKLAPGHYEYKFVVDGQWCCEPSSKDEDDPKCCPNPFGTMNRVLEVS